MSLHMGVMTTVCALLVISFHRIFQTQLLLLLFFLSFSQFFSSFYAYALLIIRLLLLLFSLELGAGLVLVLVLMFSTERA